MAKVPEINPDELDYGTQFVGENKSNPLFTQLFNQPADVNSDNIEFKVMPISALHAFPNHPYKVKVDEEMLELRDSIIDNGVLQPLIVRPRDDGDYDIISGHRRRKAAELAKLSDVPVIILKNINNETATIMMVDSNKQRELILPSERAFAYKMKMEAMSRQGQRNDLTSGPTVPKLSSRDELGLEEGISGKQINRYVRLTHLIPQLLDLVDNDALKESPSMAFRPAVEISYLKPNEQKYFYDTVKAIGKTPSIEQARKIKALSKDGILTQTDVMNILIVDKPNQRETVKMDYQRLGNYFEESLTPKECESRVFEKLDSMAKIRKSVSKHLKGRNITDEELANLVENLLVKYGKTQSKSKESIQK